GFVQPARRKRGRYVHVHAPVAERTEHAQLPRDDRAAAADVDVRDEIDAVGFGTEAVAEQLVVDVLGLRRLAEPSERGAAAPAIAAALCPHVEEETALRH